MSFFKSVVGLAQQVLDNLTLNDGLTPDERLRQQFRLPESERLCGSVDCTISVYGCDKKAIKLSPLADLPSEISITQNYLLFDNSEEKIVMHLSSIAELRKIYYHESICISAASVNGWRVLIRIDEIRSRADKFFNTLEFNWGKNLNAKQEIFKEFTKDFFSEWLVNESQLKNHRAMNSLPCGLGFTYKFPGYIEKEQRRQKLKIWYNYYKSIGRNLSIVQTQTFRKMTLQCMTNEIRGEIWSLTSGALYYRFNSPNEYQNLLETNKGKKSAALDDIEKDLNRSLPEYSAYQDEEGISKLRRVLTAYSWKVPDVGYCQGMNIICAALLIFMDEECAFWTLYLICEKIVPGYYTKTMYGALLDQRVFEELINKHMPILGEHFEKHDIKISIVSLPWFLSFFLNTMPLVFAFSVMDRFFLDGDKILFQFSLAIVKENSEKLLNCEDIGECIAVFKEYFATLDESMAYLNGIQLKFDILKQTAFNEFKNIKNSEINKEREKNKKEVIQYIDEFVKRTEMRSLNLHFIKTSQASNIYDLYYSVLLYGIDAPNDGNLKMNFYQFKLFMSKLTPWVNINYKNQLSNSQDAFLRRLFNNWSIDNILSFESLIEGLDKFVDKDSMRLITAFFNLYDSDKNGMIPKSTIMEMADDLNFITTPWRNGILLDSITNKKLEKRIAEVYIKRKEKLAERGLADDNPLPENLSYDREKYEKLQMDRYLTSGSNFLKLAFQYAIPLENDGKSVDTKDSSSSDVIKYNRALDPSRPLFINGSTFRMIIVADETYGGFFENELWRSFDIDKSLGSEGVYGAMMGGLRGAVNVVMTSGQKVASEVKRQMEERNRAGSVTTVGTLGTLGTFSSSAGGGGSGSGSGSGSNSTRDRGGSVGVLSVESRDVGNLLSPMEDESRVLNSSGEDEEEDDDDDEFGNFIPAETQGETLSPSLIDL
ncbi:GTPase-activating protein [Martiniozyma asiatica (nom. inval.)]|nr:GTPase-activating protein [Martiniozyma asiatica]